MIHLIALDEPELERLLRDPDGGLREMISNGPEVKAFLLPVLAQTRDFYQRVGCTTPWHGYLAVESEGSLLVGICAFKGKPNEGGEVEIAYGTVPGFESRGYATRAAKALVEIAFRSSAVRRVIAHTLPEPNASTRVLRKAGLDFVGEVIDPEDGRVWRWAVARDRMQPESKFGSA